MFAKVNKPLIILIALIVMTLCLVRYVDDQFRKQQLTGAPLSLVAYMWPFSHDVGDPIEASFGIALGPLFPTLIELRKKDPIYAREIIDRELPDLYYHGNLHVWWFPTGLTVVLFIFFIYYLRGSEQRLSRVKATIARREFLVAWMLGAAILYGTSLFLPSYYFKLSRGEFLSNGWGSIYLSVNIFTIVRPDAWLALFPNIFFLMWGISVIRSKPLAAQNIWLSITAIGVLVNWIELINSNSYPLIGHFLWIEAISMAALACAALPGTVPNDAK